MCRYYAVYTNSVITSHTICIRYGRLFTRRSAIESSDGSSGFDGNPTLFNQVFCRRRRVLKIILGRHVYYDNNIYWRRKKYIIVRLKFSDRYITIRCLLYIIYFHIIIIYARLSGKKLAFLFRARVFFAWNVVKRK